MSNAVAFFPWLSCKQALEIGPVRLLPFVRGSSPGDQPSMTQADIDGVLKAYSRFPNSRTKEATLLEVGDWRSGMDVPPEVLERLFEARQLIAFSALSKRRLFRGHFGYTNADTYELVVQRFKPGETGTFSFSTRRRDGSTGHLWGADEFAFQRPQHAELRATADLDEPLLAALLALPAELSYLHEAIVEFNAANTDALGVPEHVEMVMMKSAFERVLQVDHDAKRFQRALERALATIPQVEPEEPSTAPVDWSRKWGTAKPLEAWARDFCVVRGMSAHGVRRDAKASSIWTPRHHLAFGSLLFPLLVKKVLADHAGLPLEPLDLERAKRLQWYLVSDPFAPVPDSDEAEHPWSRVDTLVHVYAVAPKFYPSMATTSAPPSGGKPSSS